MDVEMSEASNAVSRLGLGCFKFGRNFGVKYPCGDGYQLPSFDNICHILEQAAKLGINLLDLAPSYGNAEQVIGKALAETNLGSEFKISSKFGEFCNGSELYYDNDIDNLTRSFFTSLKRLKREKLDYLFLHHDKLFNDDVFALMLDLKSNGFVDNIGVSVTTPQAALRIHNHVDTLFVPYNIHYRDFESFLKVARKKSVFIKKPLSSGFISEPDKIRENLLQLLSFESVKSCIFSTTKVENMKVNVSIMTCTP